ncbi:MAG: hypothetical protein A2504_15535 [Bdellovibrionales bacterium RIFOXYD12_FULL_39_22]|nr:MAG: hypothetical protein A2385_02965 [Bdellovibrionales bacterium RIFOXYB1_FULL_39_21]OFZ43205.1 MAG: hypothetical protein A2485_12110 [Bdellovibrionales bacterium RIFOXYC12_FULL_39_17]OFZ47943.1 MAG: hypothetical protein A2404_16750 [Bdellovibrionales bacterium RIFOXYC1_FULL_39_130]OFZ75723.1 MAG: hypothetical protein A2560_13250 [Bdellovibrionales bacterium RIFOXYD1_FULL_39_84]OFZ94213.1 MAG: hypothetical protein A2504_15535 [Bdellovibrionales bacterium RIFOXYD12_FULL_39_22]HLE11717.1 hy
MKRDWLITSAIFVIALSLLSTFLLQYFQHREIPYLTCKAEVADKFYSFTAKFNRTYESAINLYAKRIELTDFLNALGEFTFSTEAEENYFADELCAEEVGQLLKKARGRTFRYRETLIADNNKVSLTKMVDDLQFMYAKLNNADLNRLCCRR